VLYCSYDTGLDRGFTHYEDYVLERLDPFRTAKLVDVMAQTAAEIGNRLHPFLGAGVLESLNKYLVRDLLAAAPKKDAGVINREFVDWLSRRSASGRPFFAFLNYVDTHSRYLLPPGVQYRFGLKPNAPADFEMFERWRLIDKLHLPPHYRTLILDSYDNCLAYLDDQLGALFGELESRGILDRTLVIVTADHGESLGEHELFDHGESLYRTEIRVPLFIVLPAAGRHQAVVRETVSLRDLAATITDLLGMAAGSPFPGQSLARFWRGAGSGEAAQSVTGVLSELAAPSPASTNDGRSPAARGPLAALADDDFVYIRNDRDGREELFEARDDPLELTNRARDETMQPVLRRFRLQLARLRGDSSARGAIEPAPSATAPPAVAARAQ
jgi:arylsulfatase A-like enzyme